MSELNRNFGATSPTYATSWSREILFQNFSDLPVGKLNQIKLNFSFRHSTANASTTAHIKIFSGLKKNWTISNWTHLPASSWWQTRNNTHEYAYASDSMNNGDIPGGYQYKSATASNFITTVLAEGDFNITRGTDSQANVAVVFSGNQIKQTELSNWNQTLYLAIYSKDDTNNTKWVWPANFTPTVTFNYSQESNGSLTSSTVNLGSSSIINIAANNPSYSHKVCWFCGDENSGWQTVPSGDTSCSYSIPKKWGEIFPSSNNYPGTVQLQTYSGNSLIGTKIIPITYSVPNYSLNVKASIDYTHDYSFDTTRYFSSSSFNNKRNFLTDRTTASCTISVTTSNYALYGASISNYTTRQTNSSGGIISSSSSFSIKGNISYSVLYIVVTDSRGKIGTYTLSLNKVSYSPPVISKIEAYRVTSTSNTTKDEIGGLACLVKVSLTNATSSINGVTNSTVCKIKIGNNAEVTNTQSVAALNADSSTTYTVTVTDTAGAKITQTGTINSINYLMHFRKNVLSMGIGCAAPSTNNQLDIAWPVNLKGGLITVLPPTSGGTGTTSLESLASNSAFTNKYLSKSGGTLSGTLTINNSSTSYPGIQLWEDNEGGNIEICSESAFRYQMDGQGGKRFRIFGRSSSSDSGITGLWEFYGQAYDNYCQKGSFWSDSIVTKEIRFVDYYSSQGTISYGKIAGLLYQSSEPSVVEGAIWLKPIS